MRFLLVLLLLCATALGIAYFLAGRAEGPTITINQPSIVGQASTLDVSVDAPGRELNEVTISIEQQGRRAPLFALDSGPPDAAHQEGPDRLRISRMVGKRTVPDLESGDAMLVVTASRPVLWGLRTVSSRATRGVPVRLEPPRVGVVSVHHYINQGGAEMIVYRVTPPDVESGVRVGEASYPGFPASGAGLSGDPSVKVAFFALAHDQRPQTPMELYAKDAAGNETKAQFEHRVFPKKFRQSRIEVDDAFLAKVVPQILAGSPESAGPTASARGSAVKKPGTTEDDLLPAYLTINSELRRKNAEAIAALAAKTSETILWRGAFRQLSDSKVESGFADYRTYFYKGKEIDRQVHLGFDLARTANAPIAAANNGKVVHADDLGIYGNTVIIDHGMGVQSLYAHLSSIQVSAGVDVKQGETIGLSGQTGLAGGDHLHFSMILNGRFVNAVEWWDPHWIEDRVLRKLIEADPTYDKGR